jgi:NNP family nitrate/nitrite transporter-like MFS transporter
VAAYGPFLFSAAIGETLAWTSQDGGVKSALPFFIAAAAFYLFAVSVNWYYYSRKGCARPS